MFQLCNFWRKNIGKKCVQKMLMKLTPDFRSLEIAVKNWIKSTFNKDHYSEGFLIVK